MGLRSAGATTRDSRLSSLPAMHVQVATTWFPEGAAPGSTVAFPTMDADPEQRFFGHDFLHVLPTTKQLPANILRRGPPPAVSLTHAGCSATRSDGRNSPP